MKTYTLTAEQMQQVREAADVVIGYWKEGSIHATALMRPSVQEALIRLRDALALLDAAMQAPEATAGADAVREAYKARRRMMSEDLTEAELRELENICHPVDDALDALELGAKAPSAGEGCRYCGGSGLMPSDGYGNWKTSGNYKVPCKAHCPRPAATPQPAPTAEDGVWCLKCEYYASADCVLAEHPIRHSKPTAAEDGLREFVESIVNAMGPYPELNGHPIISAAYAALRAKPEASK